MIPHRFQQDAQDQLDKPLNESELFAAAKSMATNKAPGPDGFIIEFYTKFWPLIGSDYTQMVHEGIQRGHFPQGMNKGLLALLHKGNATDDLANWRPISLLNVAYKIMTRLPNVGYNPCCHKLSARIRQHLCPTATYLTTFLYFMNQLRGHRKLNNIWPSSN
jgi:hypothetical protein